jgi:hypothetical protein
LPAKSWAVSRGAAAADQSLWARYNITLHAAGLSDYVDRLSIAGHHLETPDVGPLELMPVPVPSESEEIPESHFDRAAQSFDAVFLGSYLGGASVDGFCCGARARVRS